MESVRLMGMWRMGFVGIYGVLVFLGGLGCKVLVFGGQDCEESGLLRGIGVCTVLSF